MDMTLSKKTISFAVAHCMISCLVFNSHAQQPGKNKIDLAGRWNFQIDSMDQGTGQRWFSKKLTDHVSLPGSMLTNGKGNEITLNTKWTGGIWDSTWYKRPE